MLYLQHGGDNHRIDRMSDVTVLLPMYPCSLIWESDNDYRKQYKYVCITTYQPDTKSNPDPNPSPTTEQHGIVCI